MEKVLLIIFIIGVIYLSDRIIQKIIMNNINKRTESEFRQNVIFTLGVLISNSDIDKKEVMKVFEEVIRKKDKKNSEINDTAREIIIRTMIRTGKLQRT